MKRVLLSVAALLTVVPGCAIEPIQPWDRDLLARDEMQLVPHPVNEFIADHIYFSKEAASGGTGIGGGGCGCN